VSVQLCPEATARRQIKCLRDPQSHERSPWRPPAVIATYIFGGAVGAPLQILYFGQATSGTNDVRITMIRGQYEELRAADVNGL
jgi:hypothetical protein